MRNVNEDTDLNSKLYCPYYEVSISVVSKQCALQVKTTKANFPSVTEMNIMVMDFSHFDIHCVL